MVLAAAVVDGRLRANPAADLRLRLPKPKAGEERVRVLTQKQIVDLVAATPPDWRRVMVRMTVAAGLRVSETLGLTWSAVDLQQRRIYVHQRVRDCRIGDPKSASSAREVPLSAETARELAALRLASPWSADDDLVFASPTGRPRSASNTYVWFKKAAAAAGVPWAGWHALRHSYASRLLLSGTDVPRVARLLGHADGGALLLRTYAHVLPHDLPSGEETDAALGL